MWVLVGFCGLLWVLVSSVVILNGVKNLSVCNKGRALPEILRFAQDDIGVGFCGFLWVFVSSYGFLWVFVSSFGFFWVLVSSFVILNGVKNLSVCNKGGALPEILRFAQDDIGVGSFGFLWVLMSSCEFL